MLSFTCEMSHAAPVHTAGQAKVLRVHSQTGVIGRKDPPRLMLQCNPWSDPGDKGNLQDAVGGRGPWSGGVRLRARRATFPPHFGVRERGPEARARRRRPKAEMREPRGKRP